MKLYIIGIILSTSIHTIMCFNSLTDIKQYAQQSPEYPLPSNDYWPDLDYTQFYESLIPSSIMRFLRTWHIISTPTWSAQNFITQLSTLVEKQENQMKGDFVVNLTYKNSINLVCWGNLYGAFHSLTRDLDWLFQNNIITEQLTLTDPSTYLVFNGNAINRGPYSLETLTIIMSLMIKNPDHVFYLLGRNEDLQWQGMGLGRELKQRISLPHMQEDQLFGLMKRFFNTLPMALYVNAMQKLDTLIRISPLPRTDTSLKDAQLAGFLTQASTPGIRFYALDRKEKVTEKVTIAALLRAEDWKRTLRHPTGLDLLDQEWGTTVWSQLSSPISSHKELYGFSDDAFVIIQARDEITESTITLYTQNALTLNGFKVHPTRNIVTAQVAKKSQAIAGFFDIGSSESLISGTPIIGQALKRGINLSVNNQNMNGGINNIYLRTFLYNDNYEPYLTVRNIEALMKQNIFTILLPTGSSNLAAYLDLIKENKILVLFPYTGGPQFRKPDLKGLVHYKASYADEVVVLLDYMINQYSVRKIAFFYQNDAYGLPPLQAAHEKLKMYNITDWIDVPYSRGATSFKEQAAKIIESQPDAICLLSVAPATQELIRNIGVDSLANKQIFAISPLAEVPFRRFIEKQGLQCTFGAVVPNPAKSKLPIVEQYRQYMNELYYGYDVFSLEAYITSSILMHALENIGQPFTNEKILAFLESLNNYEFKGLKLTFNPEYRNLSSPIWIETTQEEDWIEYSAAQIQQAKSSVLSAPAVS